MARADSPKARLGWLLDGCFDVGEPGPNRLAADVMVKQLRLLQRLELIDEAQCVGFQMLAEAVDSDPTNASLWSQYRAAELQLRQVGSNGDADEFDRLLAELQTPVSDAAVTESADQGRVRGEDREGVGPSVDAVAKPRRGRGRGAAP